MRPNGNHIQAALLRAIAAQAGVFGLAGNDPAALNRQKPIPIVEEVISNDWASATFVGATHDISVCLRGTQPAVEAAVARLVAGLPDREIPVAGHIVAEIAVSVGESINIGDNMISKSLTVNALTVMD